MTGIFRLTEPAIQDIEQIADYIARQSEYAQAEPRDLAIHLLN
jgi:toxin ParE1/3/4